MLLSSAAEWSRDARRRRRALRDLGEHRLQDLGRPEHVFQLVAPAWPRTSRRCARSRSAPRHNLPEQLTALIGREREIAEVATLLRRDAGW